MREMKNSGIEWIGEIPDDWKLVRLKDVCSNRKEIAGEKSGDYERLALTLNGVIKRDKNDSDGLQPKEFDGYQIIYANDFIFKMIDLQNISTSRVGLSPYMGLVSPAYIRFSPRKKDQFNKFAYYFLMSMYYNCVYNNLGGNGVRSALNASDMGRFVIPFPTMDKQYHIVSYLDRKLAEVDKLIDVQQAQIEKLKEYKQSIITEAVTKGLDTSAPMKDSGIEWLGKIQTTFLVEPLKFLLCEPMMYGANEKGDKTKEYYRYIRITDIESDGGLKESDDNQYLTHDVGCYYELRDGDVLFARSGGTVGKSFIFNESYGKCAFAGYLIKASCNVDALLPEYLYYYTQSSIYERWKNSVFIQATIQNIGANKFSMLPIVICSIDEQRKIVYAIKNKCAKIDKLIALKQEKIEKLNEYKKSLIYEYVTGKKEVV